MITIPQHGKSGELFDMKAFFADIDNFFRVDAWRVKIEECLGEGAKNIEEKSAGTVVFSDTEFRTAYQRIYQTIDGYFVALYQGKELCQLTAIDSTDWDISGSSEFEAHMMKKYGGRLADEA
jgi:hypothetical protein